MCARAANSHTHASVVCGIQSGASLEADMVMWCVGTKASTYFLSSTGWLTEQGLVKVDEAFRVEGQTDVFALGDCTNSREPKMAYRATEQAKTCANNVKKILKGRGTISPHKPPPAFFIVTLGRR